VHNRNIDDEIVDIIALYSRLNDGRVQYMAVQHLLYGAMTPLRTAALRMFLYSRFISSFYRKMVKEMLSQATPAVSAAPRKPVAGETRSAAPSAAPVAPEETVVSTHDEEAMKKLVKKAEADLARTLFPKQGASKVIRYLKGVIVEDRFMDVYYKFDKLRQELRRQERDNSPALVEMRQAYEAAKQTLKGYFVNPQDPYIDNFDVSEFIFLDRLLGPTIPRNSPCTPSRLMLRNTSNASPSGRLNDLHTFLAVKVSIQSLCFPVKQA